MILIIILYVLLVLGSIILEREFGIFERVGICVGVSGHIFFFSILLGIVPFMLYLEVKSRKRKGKNYDEIMKSGFILSFSVGFFWGILFSFSHGVPSLLDSLSNILGLLIIYALWGVVFGLVGMGFTKLLCKLMQIPKPSVTGSD